MCSMEKYVEIVFTVKQLSSEEFQDGSRKRLGDVVQVVGQKYYPCKPSS
jgi:hypothetical protein